MAGFNKEFAKEFRRVQEGDDVGPLRDTAARNLSCTFRLKAVAQADLSHVCSQNDGAVPVLTPGTRWRGDAACPTHLAQTSLKGEEKEK